MIPARRTYINFGWPYRIDSYSYSCIANNFRLSLECRIWHILVYGHPLSPAVPVPQLLDKCAAVLKLKSKSTLSHCSVSLRLPGNLLRILAWFSVVHYIDLWLGYLLYVFRTIIFIWVPRERRTEFLVIGWLGGMELFYECIVLGKVLNIGYEKLPAIFTCIINSKLGLIFRKFISLANSKHSHYKSNEIKALK